MKATTRWGIALLFAFTACKKETAEKEHPNKIPVSGVFAVYGGAKPDFDAELTKGDVTKQGFWEFDRDDFISTKPQKVEMSFTEGWDNTGHLYFDVKLSGLTLTEEKVAANGMWYQRHYKGTGTWRVTGEDGTLAGFFTKGKGDLTYSMVTRNPDFDPEFYDEPDYIMNLTGLVK